ncbi:MAG: hypothetical protein N2652_02995 [Kiritimatiellae bacterium]|nr:hypothetical protein [Kiritimatiellia bacterium]
MNRGALIRTTLTTLLLLGVAIATSARAAPALEKVRVSATRKTIASRKGPSQQLAQVSGRVDEDEVVYRFEIQRLAPDVPENLRVRYLVVIQGATGSLRPGVMKEEEIVLAGATPATFETEPVTLRRIEWNRSGPGSGELREKAYGWAIRVTDEQGRILLEKCQPKDIEPQLERLMKEAARPADAATEPLRPFRERRR